MKTTQKECDWYLTFKTYSNGFKDFKQNRQTQKIKKQGATDAQVAKILFSPDMGFCSSCCVGFISKIEFLNYFIMNNQRATQKITEIFPEIRNELTGDYSQNSFKLIQCFTAHIKKSVFENRKEILFQSLKIIDEIYSEGDKVLQNAIENTFIYSLDNFTAFCSKEYRKEIFCHLSQNLQLIYSRQIYKHAM